MRPTSKEHSKKENRQFYWFLPSQMSFDSIFICSRKADDTARTASRPPARGVWIDGIVDTGDRSDSKDFRHTYLITMATE